MLVLDMTICFQGCYPKHSNKVFLVPNFQFFIFVQNFLFLQLNKFERIHLKYGNIFLKLSIQKYLSKAFLVPNLRIFSFALSFGFQKIERRFKFYNSFSLSVSLIVPKEDSLDPKFKDSYFILLSLDEMLSSFNK